jgi:F-type H+-transporting ATPase subunit c
MSFIQLLAVATAIGLGAIGAGLAMGLANGHAYEAMGRNPDVIPELRIYFMMGLAFAETIIVFSLVIAVMILVR